MTIPIIGITLDEEKTSNYSCYPSYASRKNYSESIDLAGGLAIFLPNQRKKIKQYINLIDGLVITGGDFDISPKFYGKKIESEFVKVKEERTDFEYKITKEAIKKNMPILGICGGQQLLNVVLGGTLIQHIPDTVNTKINHEQTNPRDQGSHSIKIEKKTKLFNIISSDKMFVNSAHHQAVEKVGKNVVVNAIADDGVIEGIEHLKLNFCIGVQWHPEFLIDKKDIKIFEALVESSKKIAKSY